jgi:hypothetical protein
VLTVKTEPKVDFRLRITIRLLDTATGHDEAFHPVATSDHTTKETGIGTEITTTPDLAIRAIAGTTRIRDVTTIESREDNTMT